MRQQEGGEGERERKRENKTEKSEKERGVYRERKMAAEDEREGGTGRVGNISWGGGQRGIENISWGGRQRNGGRGKTEREIETSAGGEKLGKRNRKRSRHQLAGGRGNPGGGGRQSEIETSARGREKRREGEAE